MTKEDIKQLMWGAYIAGKESERDGPGSVYNESFYKDDFERWFSWAHPHFFFEATPLRPVYWHEWECKADIHTPNMTGDCHCLGRMPSEINAPPITPTDHNNLSKLVKLFNYFTKPKKDVS